MSRAHALRRVVLAAALALAAAIPPVARADIGNAGTTVGGFLTSPSGASAPGLAGTTLAFEGDLAAAAFNPASLGAIPRLDLALSHAALPDGSRHEWAALGGRLGRLSTRWGLSGLYAGQGTFEGRDASNQPTGSFSASSFALGLALAQPLRHVATLGVAAKLVNENLGSTSGTGVTFDAGLTAHAGPLGLGASARNVGGTLRYGGVAYSFPIAYGAGVSLEPASGLRLEVDANFPYDYYSDVRAGAEFRWRDRVALRAGYRRELGSDPATEPLDGPSFGLGAGMRGVWLDYAYLPAIGSETEQRIGIVLRPGAAGWRGGELGARGPEGPPAPRSAGAP